MNIILPTLRFFINFLKAMIRQIFQGKSNFFAGLLAGFMIVLFLTSQITTNVATVLFHQHTTMAPLSHMADIQLSDTQLAQFQTYTNLPVGKVESYPVKNAKGVVIYIPQIHQDPSTAETNSANDVAVVAQNQIYQIEKFLTGHSTPLLLAEGEIYGKVPNAEIGFLSQRIMLRNQLADKLQSLENVLKTNSVDPSAEQNLIATTKQEISAIDRQTILTGAAQDLRAHDAHVVLYGIEDQATLDESKPLVRDFVYLQDRISQLQNPTPAQNQQVGMSPQTSALSGSMPSQAQQMMQLLSLLGGRQQSNQNIFTSLATEAQNAGKTNLTQAVNAVAVAYNQLVQNSQTQQPTSQSTQAQTGATPSRTDNPYASISDVQKLEGMMKTSEAKLVKVVVDKRNEEIAHNSLKAIQENNQHVAILQLGAGHQDGLVRDLNADGLSVIVVTPNAVLSHPSSS